MAKPELVYRLFGTTLSIVAGPDIRFSTSQNCRAYQGQDGVHDVTVHLPHRGHQARTDGARIIG